MALFTVNTGCREQEVYCTRWDWEVTVPELSDMQESVDNVGWKLFLGLLGMGLIIGLSIIISSTEILTVDLIGIITLLGGVALLITLWKGVTSK